VEPAAEVVRRGVAANRGGKRGGRTLPQSLDRRLATYSLPGLLTLATAAGGSPTVRHRWASVGHLTARSLALAGHGSRAVDPALLEQFLAAVRRDEPRIVNLEDFLPNDPRATVLARRKDRLVRLFPGSVERPVADVERSDLVAAAVDGFLIPRRGFGVRDYVDVGLLYLDHAISVLGPTWPEDDVADLDASPYVSEAEYAAAATLITHTPLTDITSSTRRAAALRFATSAAAALPYEPDHPQSVFGRYFAASLPSTVWPELPRTQSGEVVWWLPPAFIPDALGYGVSALAGEAAGDADCARRFAQLAADRARRALWRFGRLLGPADHETVPVVSPRNVVQWVSMLGEARAVLVQLVARLSLEQLPFDEEPVAVRISREARDRTEPIRVPMPAGVLALDPRIEVVPLLLLASAGHGVALQRTGAAAMSLDDLLWAARTADADSDLFMFCRALAAADRPPMSGWEAIDFWEWWRSNGKTFFGGGAAPSFMLIEPHSGDAEWRRASDQADVERALLATRLPPVAAFDVVERTGEGPPALYAWGEPWDLL
jgi:hypothetical protein